MKNFIQKSLVLLAILGAASLTLSFTTSHNAFADFNGRDGTECPNYLGLTSWDCGVNIHDEASLKAGLWQIVANIAVDITVVAAYLILGYVIYGGYLYTLSGGDPGKVATGKKTLTQAFIGLAIVMSANLIMSTIRILLVQNGNLSNCDITTGSGGGCVDPGNLVGNLIGWVISIAGIVSAIFLVYGGITYITSSGDPGKIKNAKNMILYSLIGLVIVALASIISAFVTNTIKNANDAAYLTENSNLISSITTQKEP